MESWKMDAREVGRFVKKGGWYIAYLAARRVKEGNGQGARSDLVKDFTKSDVCSANEFAREAGLSAPTIGAYLATWDRAAGAGLVQPRHTFVGTEYNVPLPDQDAEPWEDWHTATANAGRHVVDPDRRAALIAQANADGVGASKVLDVASNRRAVIAALKADKALRDAVVAALIEIGESEEDGRTPRGPNKPRDYGRIFETAVNNLSVALAAAEGGRWEPTALQEALLYFLTRLLGANLDEIERFANAGGQR